MHRSTLRIALAVLLASSCASCTLVKPVVCSVSHPCRKIARAASSPTDDEPNDLPVGYYVPLVPVILPLSFVYYGSTGAVTGLMSGFVSDLQVLTGHATLDSTLDTLTDPTKTNLVVE